jgi:enoyl-CoA hydratase
VVPRDKLLETAEEMARKIASYNPIAVRNAKQAVVRGLDLPLPQGLDLERRLASELSLMTRRGVGKTGEENKE